MLLLDSPKSAAGRSMGLNDQRHVPGSGVPLGASDCASCEHRICELLASISATSRPQDLGRGDRLGPELDLVTVLEGLVALCTALPDGRRQLLCLLAPEDVLYPLAGPFSELWIEALAPSRLCQFDLSSHAQEIDEMAALSAELLQIAHRQINAVAAHLVTLGRLDGMERVCLFLADMAWRLGDETTLGRRVHLPLSREDIADYLGLNADTVSRMFSRVKKAKLVTFLSPTDYLVHDIGALQSRTPVTAPHAPPMSAAPNWVSPPGRAI